MGSAQELAPGAEVKRHNLLLRWPLDVLRFLPFSLRVCGGYVIEN